MPLGTKRLGVLTKRSGHDQMEDIVHNAKPNPCSRRRRRRSLSISAGAATARAATALALLLSSNGTALASSHSVGTCRLTFHVRVYRMSTSRTSRYKSLSGTVACSDSLGPWFLSGGEGPASSTGSLGAGVRPPRLGRRSCRSIVGSGTFRAAAPEFSFSIPPTVQMIPATVPIDGLFQLSTQHRATRVTAFGTLGPPPAGLDVSGFLLSGSATLVPDRHSRCGSRRWTGALALQGAVLSSYQVG